MEVIQSNSTTSELINIIAPLPPKPLSTELEDESIQKLQQLQGDSLPKISDRMTELIDLQQTINNEMYNIVRVLAGIGDDQSTSLLVTIVGEKSLSPIVAEFAFSSLENRTIRRELTRKEREIIVYKINNENPYYAGKAARIYARCIAIPPEQRIQPIVSRYHEELVTPGKIDGIARGSYLTPRIMVRNQFLLAISDIGENAGQPPVSLLSPFRLFPPRPGQ